MRECRSEATANVALSARANAQVERLERLSAWHVAKANDAKSVQAFREHIRRASDAQIAARRLRFA